MTKLRVMSHKDFLGGMLMVVLGLAAAYEASHYNLGSLRRMGPGYFPMVLGILLAAVGVLIVASSRRKTGTVAAMEIAAENLRPEWRGWICICAGIAAFCIFGIYGGLLPATFATVFISALGDRQNTLRTALVLAALMTIVCLIIFWWLLQVQFPLFRWG